MNHGPRARKIVLLGGSLLAAVSAIAMLSAADSDIPKTFTAPTANQDYVKREVMIPMRDGVKLHTVIVLPKGARNAPQGDEVFVESGYIRVFQDVRGKYKSEGNYVMTRPVRGPLNPTATDH